MRRNRAADSSSRRQTTMPNDGLDGESVLCRRRSPARGGCASSDADDGDTSRRRGVTTPREQCRPGPTGRALAL